MDTSQNLDIHVLGIAGSLRAGSYNRALLRAAQELAPEGMSIRIFDIAPIPLYNADAQAGGDPEAVVLFKTAVAEADALLIASPEYNHSIPGVLKNAIDWASVPARSSPLKGKPAALMGASTGMIGTARAQIHLRQVCAFTEMHLVNHPEVLVGRARDRFDENGRLVDETSRRFVRELLEALAAWTTLLRAGASHQK